MAYVYQHIRMDKNQPFYIGIGFDSKGKYKRAYQFGRNNLWEIIVKKTEYKVEIIEDGLTNEEAFERERYWINKLGRIDNETGILANLTDGGEGTIGWRPSTKTIDKMRKRGLSKENLEHLKRVAESNKGKPSWNAGLDKKNNPILKKIGEKIKGRISTFKGKKHKEESLKLLRIKARERATKKLECPYCKSITDVSNFSRWHGENCRLKNTIINNKFW